MTLSRVEKIRLLKLKREQRKRLGLDSTIYGLFEAGSEPKHVKSIQLTKSGWIETKEKHTATLPIACERILKSDRRFLIMIGGRGSAKSRSIAKMIVCQMNDHGKRIGCFREFQNSIKDSVYSLLLSQVEEVGFKGFSKTESSIKKDSAEAVFKGLARNPDSIKSMDGFNLFWTEEAQTVSEKSLKELTPTMRHGQLLFSANPASSEDPFSKRFITPFLTHLERDGFYEDDLHTIVVMNWKDNPWFPESLDLERKWDYENLPRGLYEHIWEGKFNDSVPNGLIDSEWFDACIDAHEKLGLKPRGAVKVTHDPSDLGGDPKALCHRHGNIILQVTEKTDGDVNEGADWAAAYAHDVKADAFDWDIGGMGAGLKRDLAECFVGTSIIVTPFNGSESPDNPDAIYDPVISPNIKQQKTNGDVFKNKRAQYYASLRDRIYKTYRAVIHGEMQSPDDIISFSSEITDLQKLRSELCRMPIKPNGRGLFELYTKPEMRSKFKLPSPNLADALMMSERQTYVVQTQAVMPQAIQSKMMR